MQSAQTLNYAVWLITLAGGVVLIGAVAALSSDAGSPFPAPYKLAWTAIALEVFSLLFALFALVVGPVSRWSSTVTALLATVTAVLIPLTNDVLALKGGLPGSNGSDTRANVAAAGLIVVMVGNFAQILLAGVSSAEPRAARAASGDTELAGTELAKDMA